MGSCVVSKNSKQKYKQNQKQEDQNNKNGNAEEINYINHQYPRTPMVSIENMNNLDQNISKNEFNNNFLQIKENNSINLASLIVNLPQKTVNKKGQTSQIGNNKQTYRQQPNKAQQINKLDESYCSSVVRQFQQFQELNLQNTLQNIKDQLNVQSNNNMEVPKQNQLFKLNSTCDTYNKQQAQLSITKEGQQNITNEVQISQIKCIQKYQNHDRYQRQKNIETMPKQIILNKPNDKNLTIQQKINQALTKQKQLYYKQYKQLKHIIVQVEQL